jgi:hypothetical protein
LKTALAFSGSDKDVHVAGRTRLRVDTEGVTTNQKVLNGMRVKSLEKVFEVLGHHGPVLS